MRTGAALWEDLRAVPRLCGFVQNLPDAPAFDVDFVEFSRGSGGFSCFPRCGSGNIRVQAAPELRGMPSCGVPPHGERARW